MAGMLVLGLTNPSKEDYVDYASNRLYTEAKSGCSNLNQSVRVFLVGIPTGDVCRLLVITSDKIGRPLSKKLIESATNDRSNFGLFSIYTTQVPGGKVVRTVGIGAQFVVFAGG